MYAESCKQSHVSEPVHMLIGHARSAINNKNAYDGMQFSLLLVRSIGYSCAVTNPEPHPPQTSVMSKRTAESSNTHTSARDHAHDSSQDPMCAPLCGNIPPFVLVAL